MICKAEFFGTGTIPEINLDKNSLEKLAKESASIGLTIPGVQKKLSLHLSDDNSSRLTLVGYPAGYILKPQTEDFEQLPEAEDLVMDIAEMMGVNTAEHGLIEINGKYSYITKRADRKDGKFFAMEDFCQLSERLTQDKYKGSYERCAKVIRDNSTLLGYDLSEFYLRLIVSFVTGNSDMHLKNFSLIERTPGGRDFVLSPAYDMLPVNVVMPEDTEEMALTLNGRKSNITRQDFLSLAENIGINSKTAVSLIDSVISKEADAIQMCEASFLSKELKGRMISMIAERCLRLRSK